MQTPCGFGQRALSVPAPVAVQVINTRRVAKHINPTDHQEAVRVVSLLGSVEQVKLTRLVALADGSVGQFKEKLKELAY